MGSSSPSALTSAIIGAGCISVFALQEIVWLFARVLVETLKRNNVSAGNIVYLFVVFSLLSLGPSSGACFPLMQLARAFDFSSISKGR